MSVRRASALTPEMQFFWKALDFIILTIGGSMLLFILKLTKDMANTRADFKTQVKLFTITVNNLKSQFSKLEAWVDSPERQEVVTAVRQVRDEMVAIKGALKSHDERILSVEKAVAQLARRVGLHFHDTDQK